jgi:hypothetical protein
MLKITNEYYSLFNNVDTYYYCYDNSVKATELKGNILYIKGNETYIPGILNKTIAAFEYFKENLNNYNYVVRSNISTIIRFDLLIKELQLKKVKYGCALCNELKGINYSSGTSIILRSDLVLDLISNKEMIDYSLIDDVSIGKYMNEIGIMPEPILTDKFHFLNLNENIETGNKVFFRNRNDKDRNLDADQMEEIINKLK